MQELLEFIGLLPRWLVWLTAAGVMFVIFRRPLGRAYIRIESARSNLLVPILAVLVFIFASAAGHRLEILIDVLGQGAPPPTDADQGMRDALQFLWPFHDAKAGAHFAAFALLGAILLVLTYLLYRLRYSLFDYDIEEKPNAAPRAVVVMGLSELPKDKSELSEQRIAQVEALTLAEACATNFGQPNFAWQQNLRVLAHHFLRNQEGTASLTKRRPRIPGRRVVILPSPQSDPARFIPMARACLHNSGIQDVSFETWPTPVDYGRLGDTRDALREILTHLRASTEIGARYEDISIDTTPGQKVLSIAAAAVTFASPAEFTYVEPKGRVVVFDVIATFRAPPNR